MQIGGSTAITYPSGSTSGKAEVIGSAGLADGRTGVLVGQTPFHPLDHTWPDQPADTGVLTADGRALNVVDCVTGAVEEGGEQLFVGDAIPVRRGSDGWHWLVVHVVDDQAPADGTEVTLTVDEGRRMALSTGHTACHLAALALNAALAGRWRKETAQDALGHPDFDQTAITESKIEPYGSTDRYRLGKSLRKKGFATEGLAEALPEVTARADELLAAWVAADAKVWVDSPGPELTARRTWHCALPDGEASIPCGGTHVTGTAALGEVTVTLSLDADASELTMVTVVAGR